MLWVRSRGLALLLIFILLSGCSLWQDNPPVKSEQPPSPPVKAEAPSTPDKPKEAVAEPPKPPPRRIEVSFRLFSGPMGFRLPDSARVIQAGSQVVIGVDSLELDVLIGGLSEAEARASLKVQGATLARQADWLPEGGLALQFGTGKAGERIQVSLEAQGTPPASITLVRAARATVEVDQRYGDTWKPVTVLSSSAQPGPAEIRLTFSKPVRRAEVEKALELAQSGPVRGIMQWADDQTLIWRVIELPPRLDFLLGGAHDQDGLPLPGGIPSVRVGGPPLLVEVELANPADLSRAQLPPDIISAELTRERAGVNLKVWTPGTNRWDWTTLDLHLNVGDWNLKSGWLDPILPRVPSDLESWQVNPQGILVAGLRTEEVTAPVRQREPYKTALVIMDLRGDRRVTYPSFIGRFLSASHADLTSYLTWSGDGQRVAALDYRGGDPATSDLVSLDVNSGQREVLVPNLPIPAPATRLSWSPDGRYVLVGHLLVDPGNKSYVSLAGKPEQARGVWEPEGSRLLYGSSDWGDVFVVDPTAGDIKSLGTGVVVGWSSPGRVYLIRWPGSNTRYVPPGM